MSLKARDFFNIPWMHTVPGIYISFEGPNESEEPLEPQYVPTHSVEILVEVVGMQRQLSGTMAVSWSEADFAQHNSASLAEIINNSIVDKLCEHVKLTGSIKITKL